MNRFTFVHKAARAAEAAEAEVARQRGMFHELQVSNQSLAKRQKEKDVRTSRPETRRGVDRTDFNLYYILIHIINSK